MESEPILFVAQARRCGFPYSTPTPEATLGAARIYIGDVSENVFPYRDGSVELEGYIACAPDALEHRPAVLIAHQITGISDHERAAADRLAALGFVGIAIDVYGKLERAAGNDSRALMAPFMQDRNMLLRRLVAAIVAAKQDHRVDANHIALIGYCFGGMCALDVARSGTDDVRGVVSLHGALKPPGDVTTPKQIRAKVLILHGWSDPHIPPSDVLAVTKELTAARADWQLHAYGGAMHGFTQKSANSPERGVMYNAEADRRSWHETVAFLHEVLEHEWR